MTVEMSEAKVEMIESCESSYLETLANVASRSGPKMQEAIEEFLQGVQDGKITIFFRPFSMWRADRRWQEHGTVNLFLPSEYPPNQAEREVVPVLTDTLAITRRLSGPRLHTKRQFGEELREEQKELAMSLQL